MITKKLLLVIIIFSMAACMMPPVNVTYQVRNDLALKDTWKNFLAQNPNPKVVLRVPDRPKDITQSEMMTYDSFYNYIERSLLEANFTVRDRSLLKEVLNRAGGELGYADIGKKIDTDCILEIVSVKLGTWMRGTVSGDNQSGSSGAGWRYEQSDRSEDQQASTAAGPNVGEDNIPAAHAQKRIPLRGAAQGPGDGRSNNEVFGAIIEGRIIMVVTGDVVGMFTLKEIHPHPEEWFGIDANNQPIRIKGENLNDSDIEYMRNSLTQKMINFMKGISVPDSSVTLSGYEAPVGRIGKK
jgi:hypothetical protein